MWQHHDLLHRTRYDALRAEADRERRWRLQDEANGRPRAVARGGVRATFAAWIAAVSRGAARLARRLDERVVLDLGAERMAPDA